jgi:glycosyltransferase involved in cell wall biosynthesis
VGLKGHELMIESLAEVMKEFPKLYAVFIGQQWGESQAYYEKLKTWADKLSSRILFTGYIPQTEIAKIWQEFDLALHLPSSENCGGVIEPLLNGVPVIASAVGGLPEIILTGETGYLVEERRKEDVVQKLREALLEKEASLAFAQNGKRLVQNLFDIKRTSQEISGIYKTILEKRTLRDHQ